MNDEDYDMQHTTATQLYRDILDFALDNCNEYPGSLVASTMLGIALRLYRTSLTEEKYYMLMDYFISSVDSIKPYTSQEIQRHVDTQFPPTIH